MTQITTPDITLDARIAVDRKAQTATEGLQKAFLGIWDRLQLFERALTAALSLKAAYEDLRPDAPDAAAKWQEIVDPVAADMTEARKTNGVMRLPRNTSCQDDESVDRSRDSCKNGRRRRFTDTPTNIR